MIAPNAVITIACSATWLASSVAHFISSAKERRPIRLQDDQLDDREGHSGLDEDELEALDHVRTQLDGEPIDEANFQRHIRRARQVLSALAIFTLSSLCIHLATQVLSPRSSWQGLIRDQASWPFLALILSWLNILYFAAFGLRGAIRWAVVVHLAVLSLVASMSCLALLVIPDAIAHNLFALYVVQLCSALLALFVSVTIPSGARRIKNTPDGSIPMARLSHKGRTVLSRLWFTNSFDLVRTARTKGHLDKSDAPLLGSDLDAHMLHMHFTKAYSHGTKGTAASSRGKMFSSVRACWPILRAVASANKVHFVANQCLSVIAGFIWYLPAYVSFRIVHFLEEAERNEDRQTGANRLRFGFQFALLMSGTIIVQSLLIGQLFSLCSTWLRNRIRAQLQMAIFTKALRRKDVGGVEEFKMKDVGQEDVGGETEDGTGAGVKQSEDSSPGSFSKSQIINLVSVDAERVSDIFFFITLSMSPIEILTGGFFAIYLLKWGAIVGLLSSLAIQPFIYIIGKITVRLQDRQQEIRDRKTSLLNEVIQSIRMVKFNAWEGKASARIQRVRDEELHYQRLMYFTEAIQSFIFLFSPIMTTLIAYGWYVFVEKKPLTPSVAFTALAVLEEMRFALTYLPDAITKMIQTLVSLRRIQEYLESDEVTLPQRSLSPATHVDIAMSNATVRWPLMTTKDKQLATAPSSRAEQPSTFCLLDVSIRFTPNTVNLIVGKLGSGKTLLLQGLLGEADLLAGQVICPRSLPNSINTGEDLRAETWMRADQLAYVPQTAFLVNATLRDNILFGLPMLEDRYQATLDACGLRPDLKIFDDGDETEIGENGIGLSGGQTIRVMLARAVYGRASTLILDDPLSAVDAHTAAHIHTQLLQGPLCKSRTVILVTHQVQLVAQSSAQVIMLEGGRVAFQGDPFTFMKSDMYNGLIEEQDHEIGEKEKDGKDLTSQTTSESSLSTTPATTAPPSPQINSKDIPAQANIDAVDAKQLKQPRKLVEEEQRAKGAVLLSIYARYINAAGGLSTVLTVVALLVAANSFQIVTTRWLQYWTEDVVQALKNGSHIRQHSDKWWIVCWAMIWLAQMFLETLKMVVLALASLRASRILFKGMLTAVLQAPLRFHDTVSRGRLLNRFGYDFEEMDSEMVDVLERVGDQAMLLVVSIFAVATGGGLPFLVFFASMVPVYVVVGKMYMTAVRDLKRLSSTTRSPILNAFGDVVRGAVVVRAFGASEHFSATLIDRINDNMTFAFWINELRWWYENLFNTISFFVLLAATIFVLLNASISASQAGFIFTFLINTHLHILLLLQAVTNMEQKLVSVERIVEYSKLEGEQRIEGNVGHSTAEAIVIQPPPPSWPEHGQVEVKDLHVRYAADLPEVLKGVSFSIPRRAKVGIVGPTGCGKSTLASTFFRFVEKTQGSVTIDGVDIGNVDLYQLRSRLQIVPQDPIIFSGPIRASLDVFDEYSDAEVLDALRKVHLLEENHASASVDEAQSLGASTPVVQRRDFGDLNFVVSEGGANLSNGEKQLLCLARAILRRCKLIIFDEATSSVDFDTDALISQTIRQAFDQSTIITIAHRLRTIIDYDFVLVMEQGKAVEYASPANLLRDPTSRFYKLCRATGKRELAHLKQVAGSE